MKLISGVPYCGEDVSSTNMYDTLLSVKRGLTCTLLRTFEWISGYFYAWGLHIETGKTSPVNLSPKLFPNLLQDFLP